jgi:hypothetical protein
MENGKDNLKAKKWLSAWLGMKLGLFSLFFLDYWMKINDLVPPPALATLGILNYTHLYQTFWVGLAKVSYNNF